MVTAVGDDMFADSTIKNLASPNVDTRDIVGFLNPAAISIHENGVSRPGTFDFRRLKTFQNPRNQPIPKSIIGSPGLFHDR